MIRDLFIVKNYTYYVQEFIRILVIIKVCSS